ncbi:MAG: hypothetical protein M3Y25_05950, partial [Thermoproteota archaeon]|nr:hypothetical protein [Thermoproteota archaeon]
MDTYSFFARGYIILILVSLTLVLLVPNTFLVFSSDEALKTNPLGPDRLVPKSVNDHNVSFNRNTTLQVTSETGMEIENKNNWIFVNHDVFGTRNSNQTEIGKSNVDELEVKWRLNNTFEIQEPPLIVNKTGFFQDYIGNIISFDTLTGNINWKLETEGGPTMGLYYSEGLIYATVGTEAKLI